VTRTSITPAQLRALQEKRDQPPDSFHLPRSRQD
jgi:hypothetical protein